jgi:hypothetical protein
MSRKKEEKYLGPPFQIFSGDMIFFLLFSGDMIFFLLFSRHMILVLIGNGRGDTYHISRKNLKK